MTDEELFRIRVGLVQCYLAENEYDGILLNRVDNFAMATGGRRNYVNIAGDGGACGLFIPREGTPAYVGNNIEATRVMDEELAGFDCDTIEFLWFESSGAAELERRVSGRIASDDGSIGPNVNGELAYLRSILSPRELDKYRALGKLAAAGMTAAVQAVQPGMTEPEIAALLRQEGAKRDCWVPVCLIAVDDRIAKYRHPLPTTTGLAQAGESPATLNGYVMVVGCFVREGLTVSLTRFKRVGAISSDVRDAMARIAAVDAVMQEASQPGATLGGVFASCQNAYARYGFAHNEWHHHHQGGMTGYQARTCKGAPGETFPIADTSWADRLASVTGLNCTFGHAFAWNPSAPGVKSEDTFILDPEGRQELVTRTPEFPDINLEAVLGRPASVVKSGIME